MVNGAIVGLSGSGQYVCRNILARRNRSTECDIWINQDCPVRKKWKPLRNLIVFVLYAAIERLFDYFGEDPATPIEIEESYPTFILDLLKYPSAVSAKPRPSKGVPIIEHLVCDLCSFADCRPAHTMLAERPNEAHFHHVEKREGGMSVNIRNILSPNGWTDARMITHRVSISA